MAKITVQEAIESFSNDGRGADFFVLKQDKESVVVRMLVRDVDDLDIYTVHRVNINEKDRYVDCLGAGECPLCASGDKVTRKIFIQMIDERDGKLKIWDRGKSIIDKMNGLVNKYGSLYNRRIEIERHGKPKDPQTDYVFYVLDSDDTDYDSLPAKKEIAGVDKLILVKTKAELQALVNGNPAPVFQPRGNRTPEAF